MTYLDHASSTPTKFFAKDYYIFANPNSPHAAGLQANQALNEARDRIKSALGVKSGKVVFCRCATEAVEWLCKWFKRYWGNCSLSESYCPSYEHESVYNACRNVEPLKNLQHWVGEYNNDSIYLHQFCSHLTGQIFDIESIGKQIQSTGAFFGSDITAGLGKYPLSNNLDTFCDAVWFSGRKIGCETMGAIWLSDRLFQYLGGSEDSRNEHSLIHGTSNVGGAIALSHAVKHAVKEAKANNIVWGQLVNYMCTKLLQNDILHHIYGVESDLRTHAINALYLPKFNADALVQFLSSRDIYVSPCYSACSSNADYRIAEALNITKEQASQTIRVSFGDNSSVEDVDKLIEGIVEFKELFM